jgi:hypothetical protein
MHALIENGAVKQYPYGFGQLKAANSSTSFPLQATDEMLASFGVERVFFSTPPEITNTQALVEGTPVIVDNQWTQVWAVRDMTAEEVASRNESQAANIRAQRGTKLAECDWTQVADAPVNKAIWATYRQALRNIPSQEGFPWSVIWPDAP